LEVESKGKLEKTAWRGVNLFPMCLIDCWNVCAFGGQVGSAALSLKPQLDSNSSSWLFPWVFHTEQGERW